MNAQSTTLPTAALRGRRGPSREAWGRRILAVLAVLAALFGSASAIEAQTPVTVTVQWDANVEPDVAGYEVSYGTQSGVYGTPVDVGNVTSTSISIAPGTIYYFAVRAYTSSSPRLYSPYSAEVSYGIKAALITRRKPGTILGLAGMGRTQLNATTFEPDTIDSVPPSASKPTPRDGQAELLWRNQEDGANAVWQVDDIARVATRWLPAEPDRDWALVAAADINSDGQADLIWRNLATGAMSVWTLDHMARTGVESLDWETDLDWLVIGTGDLNGDGKPDLVWRNRGERADARVASGRADGPQLRLARYHRQHVRCRHGVGGGRTR